MKPMDQQSATESSHPDILTLDLQQLGTLLRQLCEENLVLESEFTWETPSEDLVDMDVPDLEETPDAYDAEDGESPPVHTVHTQEMSGEAESHAHGHTHAHVHDEEPAPDAITRGEIRRRVAALPLSESDRMLGVLMVDLLDDHGYFKSSPADAARSCQSTPEDILRVLPLLHAIEPTGLFTANAAQSLILRLQRKGSGITGMDRVLAEHFEDFAMSRFALIQEATGVSEADQRTLLAQLRTLRPHACTVVPDPDAVMDFTADLICVEHEGLLHVELGRAGIPELTLNPDYKKFLRAVDTSARDMMQQQYDQAENLIQQMAERDRILNLMGADLLAHHAQDLRLGQHISQPGNLSTIAESAGLPEARLRAVLQDKRIQGMRSILTLLDFYV